MRRSLIIAAVALALAALSGGTPATAQARVYSTDDFVICGLLEQAHESTCAEYLAMRALDKSKWSGETTGSVRPKKGDNKPFEPKTVPVRR